MAPTNKDVCPHCKRLVIDRGIQCDSDCSRWFHPECVGLNKTEYSAYANDVNKKWTCDRVDCYLPNQDPLLVISANVTALLEKFSTLATKDEFKTEIEEVKMNIASLSTQIADLEPRLSTVEAKISALEQRTGNVGENSNFNSANYENVIAEINDRNARARNIILFKIPESSSQDVQAKRNHDKTLIKIILTASNLEEEDLVTFYRLGKTTATNHRPLKVVLVNKEKAIKLLRNFKRDVVVKINASLSETSISSDKTPAERGFLADLRSQLNDRIGKGETGLTIKFFNGTPKIVQMKKND